MGLAVGYRPRNPRDVVGQDVLVRILKNAFELNRVPRSMLLDGQSGVGKTTIARIIALCINCVNGATIDPCGKCISCTSIMENRHPDVVEIDAASHTGIDEIRDILESSRYVPLMSPYKVYIIDEVHMLSNSAFNALLKTLEEPFAHVKFILATTEVRKIPVTVVSRCQHLQLVPIRCDIMCQRMIQILKNEQISYHDDALQLIASNSSGSMRNALALLEQAIFYNDTQITVESVRMVLGLSDDTSCYEVLLAILDKNAAQALNKLRQGLEYNDPLTLLDNIAMTVHATTMFLLLKTHEFSVSEANKSHIENIAKKTDLAVLTLVWQVLCKGIQDVRQAVNAMLMLEMLVIKLSIMRDLPTPAQIIKSISSAKQTSFGITETKKIIDSEISYEQFLDILRKKGYGNLCSSVIECTELDSIIRGSLCLKQIKSVEFDLRGELDSAIKAAFNESWKIMIVADGKVVSELAEVRKFFPDAKLIG